MFRQRFLCLLALLCLLLFSSIAHAKEVLVFLRNNAGSTMTYLYISETGKNSWEEDILGPDMLNIRTLENGYYCEFTIDDSVKWDLRAEFRNGDVQEYYDFDFARYKKITLNRNAASME